MDNSTREKVIQLPKTGHTVVLKEYLTVKEERNITKAAMRLLDGESAKGEEKHTLFTEFQKVEIDTCVVSINGNSEDINSRLEEYPNADFLAIVSAIKETRGENLEKKSE